MLGDEMGPGRFHWKCIECPASGYGGASGFTIHYIANHSEPTPTYISYLREARNEHGLKGAAAYQWAHNAWAEYEKNQ